MTDLRIIDALEHTIKVFRSMSGRGAYPQELLPFDIDDYTKDSPVFLGKQGYTYLIEALKIAKEGA